MAEPKFSNVATADFDDDLPRTLRREHESRARQAREAAAATKKEPAGPVLAMEPPRPEPIELDPLDQPGRHNRFGSRAKRYDRRGASHRHPSRRALPASLCLLPEGRDRSDPRAHSASRPPMARRRSPDCNLPRPRKDADPDSHAELILTGADVACALKNKNSPRERELFAYTREGPCQAIWVRASSRRCTVRSIFCSLSRPNRPIRNVLKPSGSPTISGTPAAVCKPIWANALPVCMPASSV